MKGNGLFGIYRTAYFQGTLYASLKKQGSSQKYFGEVFLSLQELHFVVCPQGKIKKKEEMLIIPNRNALVSLRCVLYTLHAQLSSQHISPPIPLLPKPTHSSKSHFQLPSCPQCGRAKGSPHRHPQYPALSSPQPISVSEMLSDLECTKEHNTGISQMSAEVTRYLAHNYIL